jgi:hypothetical protein
VQNASRDLLRRVLTHEPTLILRELFAEMTYTRAGGADDEAERRAAAILRVRSLTYSHAYTQTRELGGAYTDTRAFKEAWTHTCGLCVHRPRV